MKSLLFWVALLSAGSASAIQRYDVTVLPTGFFGTDRNDSGTIVGRVTNSSGVSVAAMYSGTTLTLLPGAAGARGINNDGTMIAVSIGSVDRGFIRTAGASSWTELTLPGFTSLNLFDINNAGVVGGAARSSSGGTGFTYDGSGFTLLPNNLPNGGVFSLNDAGDAVGRYSGGSANWVKIDGVYTAYTGFSINRFEPGKINNAQQVVGSYRNASGVTVAVVLEEGVFRPLSTLRSSASFLNNLGYIIGSDPSGEFIYDPIADRSFVLNDLIDGAPISGVSGIYDDGTILGWRSANVPGGLQGVLLTPYGSDVGPPTPNNPVPEPASWVMLIAGFGLVGAMQRRRVSYNRVAARPDRA